MNRNGPPPYLDDSDFQIAYPSLLASFVWTVILALAVIAGSFALSCSAPFAALAVALTATIGIRASLGTMTLVWLVNQIAGFALFHFPHTLNTVLWGFAIGSAALLTTLVSSVALRRASSLPPLLRLGLCLVLSFVAYEFVLWLATFALGGRETFALPIVLELGLINGVWLAAMIALNEIAATLCKPWLGRMPMIVSRLGFG